MDDDWAEDDGYTRVQGISIANGPRITALFSLLGSSLIIMELLEDNKSSGKHRTTATTRTLFALSVSDIFLSFGWLLSTWPMPPTNDGKVWGNYGNISLCNMQATIIQFGWVASPLFNVVLGLFYLLRIRYNWNDARLKKLEVWFHGTIWTVSLICAIYPIPFGLYNPAWNICWIEAAPMGCLPSGQYGEDATCTKADNAWKHAIFFTIFPVWISLFLSFAFLFMIFLTVRQNEAKMSKYAGSVVVMVSNDGDLYDSTSSYGKRVNRKRSLRVANQALFYLFVFTVCFTPDTINCVMYYMFNIWYFSFDFFTYALLPLQGFCNFLVFSRNRQMKTRAGSVARRVFFCKAAPPSGVVSSGDRTSLDRNSIGGGGGRRASRKTSLDTESIKRILRETDETTTATTKPTTSVPEEASSSPYQTIVSFSSSDSTYLQNSSSSSTFHNASSLSSIPNSSSSFSTIQNAPSFSSSSRILHASSSQIVTSSERKVQFHLYASNIDDDDDNDDDDDDNSTQDMEEGQHANNVVVELPINYASTATTRKDASDGNPEDVEGIQEKKEEEEEENDEQQESSFSPLLSNQQEQSREQV